jgi:hypothetical protein
MYEAGGKTLKEALREYMEKYGIKNIKEFGDLFGEPKSSMNYWVGGKDGTNDTRLPPPKKIEKIKKFLQQTPEEIKNESIHTKANIESAANIIKGLIPIMKSIVADTKVLRIAFRENLGKDFETFLNLTRALTSETARDTVLKEKLLNLEGE